MKTKSETIKEIKTISLSLKKLSCSLSNEIKESLVFYTNTLDFKSSITERAFCLINKLSTSPICKVCNSKKLKFISFEKGFEELCSSKCEIKLKSESGVLMSKKELKEKLNSIYLKLEGPEYESFLKKESLLFSLKTYTPFVPDTAKNTERIFCIVKDISSIPLCKHCKEKEVKYINFDIGYRNYCSVKCSSNSDQKQLAIAETNMENHGHVNSFQSEEGRKGYNEFYKDEEKIEKSVKKGIKTKIKNHGKDAFKKIAAKSILTKQTTFIDGQNLFQIAAKKAYDFKIKNYGGLYKDPKELRLKILKNTFDKKIKFLKKINVVPLFKLSEFKGVENIRYMWKCEICTCEYSQTLDNGKIPFCPKCNKNNGSSIGENELIDFLKDKINIQIRNRKLLKPKEIDIVIESKKVGIEYDGLYFHSYERLLFRNNFTQSQAENYHLMKTTQMKEAGYDLIHIFEHEWVFKKEITKSIILNKLGLTENKIGARDCYIKEISLAHASKFLEENHIQGKDTSKIRVGLFLKKDVKGYNKDTLVSLMTFKKPRYNKEAQWELKRFCSLLNVNIQGAASKLLKYFEETYKPFSLLSYADKRYSFSSVYENLGFEYKGDTKPNYFYIKNYNVYSRDMFMKHKIKEYFEKEVLIKSFDEELTEYENMVVNGFKKIYDCGNKIFIKRYV